MKVDNGKLIDFDGRPVSHSREKPWGMVGYEESRDFPLPFDAWVKGWHLVELIPARYSYSADPFVLYDRWGHILYRWPDNYEPSWVEVREICEKLCQAEGR